MSKNEDQPHTEEPLEQKAPASRFDLRAVKKCGARCKRTGLPCQQPAMPNGRCRLHGGKSQGAPRGNKNALKHGYYSAEEKKLRAEVREHLRMMKEMLKGL